MGYDGGQCSGTVFSELLTKSFSLNLMEPFYLFSSIKNRLWHFSASCQMFSFLCKLYAWTFGKFSEDTTKLILTEGGGRGLRREDRGQNNKTCFSGSSAMTSESLALKSPHQELSCPGLGLPLGLTIFWW